VLQDPSGGQCAEEAAGDADRGPAQPVPDHGLPPPVLTSPVPAGAVPKEIVMPAENAADLDDMLAEIRSELEFHLVHDRAENVTTP
jgi:hypothetical protein